MRRKFHTAAIMFVLVLFLFNLAVRAQAPLAPAAPGVPKTAVNEVKETIHGVEITDPYRWLEDQNSPETRAWIDEQNAYTDSVLAKIPGRDALKAKVSALLKIETMNTPTVRNGRYFFTRRRADQDQAMLYVRQGLNGKDELLVDPLALSPQHTITVNLNSVSKDGSLIVYSLRSGGEDETTPRLFDVNARKDLPDQFPRARYSGIAILPDKSGVYLTRQTPEGPRVYFHKIGGSDADTEIFGKGYGPEKIINASLSNDGHYLIINVSYGSAATKNEVYFQDLKSKGAIVPVVNDVAAAFSSGGGEGPNVGGDKLYLRTNWNAPKWRVLEVDLKNPARDHWREVIPEGENAIDSLSLAGGKLVVAVTQDVVNHLRLYDINGKPVREINPPTLGNLSGLRGEWDRDEGFYTFNSFHIPSSIYRYDVATGKQTVWFQSPVPIQSDQYEVKQVWYPSKDGTKIPMFLAHAKGLKLDGSHPTLLTGYGGFNLNSNPTFSPFAAAWMESGGVWALANMRGGGEFGEAWHHAGMLDKKQNVFDDFIAAGEWLVKNKYTSPERLAIRGRSNGGLLMGAALTQRPDLFAAVSCGYPLLDMVRYHKFLVASYWVPEYGSSDNADQFKYIYAYSPYQHVKPGTKYPAVLFISGDSDTRVAPLHARKMAALMQASTGSDKPVLLHYDTKAGHSGGTPVSKEIDEVTDELNFLMWQLGMTPRATGK
ncbi:MAG TPA: prolyl oligopeptidase family serine peptidase [Candidatus Angelobacter sp.]|nr:prolyl oligopeptidase family serine peptidase [Candidatus Angelobacter sp.]